MKTLFLLMFTAVLTFAQNDTLFEALKYYPLQNGNHWEYANHYWEFPYYDDSSFYSIEITGDTLLFNNNVYNILTRKNIPFDGYIGKTYERVDSATACVYRFTEDTIFVNNEYLIDSLLAKPGNYFGGSYYGFTSNQGVFSTLCLNLYEDTVLNYLTEIRELEDQSGIPAINLLFAKGFGFINSSSCEFGCSITNLRYANIDGVEYGTQITSTKKPNNQQQKAFILYQNYPNPFNPTTNIVYSIPKPGLVSLKVYDVLGNEVAALVNEEKPAGRYNIKFDGSDFASGIYFYQLKAGSFTQNKKMILLR